MFSSGGGGGSSSGIDDMTAGMTQLFGGLFGHSDKPYRESAKVLEDYLGRATGAQNPFYNYGKRGMVKYNEWLKGMKDPSGFVNGLMENYGESPWAKFQQEQALRASGNAGSASGMTDSTPMAQFNQQNARDISSQDMNTWLKNVLGVNSEYGEGQKNMMGMGQHSADVLGQLYQNFGENLAGAKYNSMAAKNRDRADIWGGIFRTGGGAAKEAKDYFKWGG